MRAASGAHITSESGGRPNGLEMSRPASASILRQTRFAAAGRVGSIELLGRPRAFARGLEFTCVVGTEQRH